MSDHIGRSFTGHPLEDTCPCPQEPCGLVDVSRIDPTCPQHALHHGQTIRQAHTAERCPVTTPTSPKPPTPADPTESKDVGTTLDKGAADAGLRTALTKLAVPMYYDATPGAYPVTAVPMSHLLSALAAHPAAETPVPGADTRREDDDLLDRAVDAIEGIVPSDAEGYVIADTPLRPMSQAVARAVLAALPAPPDAVHLIAAVTEHEPHLDETACYDGGCLCGWYGTETEHEAHRLAAVTEALALPAPPVVDEVPDDAPPYLVGIPEDMAGEPLSGDEWVEVGFDAGVAWGAWDARRRMPVVDEAEVRERIIAREVLTSALTDPDDPDWLTKEIAHHWWDRNTGDTELWDDLTEAEQVNVIENVGIGDFATAARAAILGGAS